MLGTILLIATLLLPLIVEASPESGKSFFNNEDLKKISLSVINDQPMLNFISYVAGKIHFEGNEAQQTVIITDKNGNKAAYLFSLSKQKEGLSRGCWMAGSVFRLKYEEKKMKT